MDISWREAAFALSVVFSCALTPEPYSWPPWSLDSLAHQLLAHSTALPLHKCFMEHMQCSRYGFGIRDIKMDRLSTGSVLMEEYILRQSEFILAPPSHMILCQPPPPPRPLAVSLAGLSLMAEKTYMPQVWLGQMLYPMTFSVKTCCHRFSHEVYFFIHLIIHGGKK